jgi:hypothetical protein
MERLNDAGIPFPAALAEYVADDWECWSDWHAARQQWCKDNGFPYKRLPLVQQMTRDVWIKRLRAEGLTNDAG